MVPVAESHVVTIEELAAGARRIDAAGGRQRQVEAGEPVVRRHHVVGGGAPHQRAIGAIARLDPERTIGGGLHRHDHGVVAEMTGEP